MSDFGILLSNRRNEMGLSLEHLQRRLWEQKKIRVSRTFLNFLENGKKKPPYDLAVVLAEVLSINTKEILRAAYHARTKYDRDREKGYLQKALENNNLGDIKLEEIVTQLETN